MSDSQTKISVLLVDDLPVNLLVLKAVLGSLDAELVEAHSGEEALKCLRERDFAVILLDIMMPEMDGFETARQIREMPESKLTPIIFVTAMFLEDNDEFRGYSLGAVDYIMKPFVPAILRSKVSIFVDLYKKTEEIKQQAEHIRDIERREILARLTSAEDRLRQETERKDNEARTARAILEHAPVGFAILSPEHAIIEMNNVFFKQFSLSDDVIGKPLDSVFPDLPESVNEAIKSNQPFRIHDWKIEQGLEEANNRYCDLAVWPVSTDAGISYRTLLVTNEVTERVLLELQRSDFVATLAHDLQTPVIASDRALSLVLDKIAGLSPDLISLVTMLKKNNQNLLHMIESLLDIYHYSEGSGALNLDEVDIELLAGTCIDELTPLAHAQGLTIERQIAADLNLIQSDRTAMRRVITNLLDNSIKFTPKGGLITVQARNQGDKIIFQVTDTGIGIRDEDKNRLFERFWHGTGHKSYKGSSGLGLYLCRQIVKSHHGEIECESDYGKGTTFTVILPTKMEGSRLNNGVLSGEQSAK